MALRAASTYANPVEYLIAQVKARTGYQIDNSDIPADMTFRQWCEDLAKPKVDKNGNQIDGMKIDGKPFKLDDRPALIPIYDAIPTTPEEAKDAMLIVQKATQLGLTVWEILANLYMAKKFAPVTIGMFMPDQATAAFKSEHRFMRIVRSVPKLLRELIHRMDSDGEKKVGEGNILTRTFGESLLLFLWTSGKVSTESRPMDIVTLDEVQEMALDQIDKVRARMGDSNIAFALLLSTANLPDLDINYWYQAGTQEEWHTECPHCKALSDLSDPATNFPKRSIGYNTGQIPGAPMNEYVWLCPECGGWIEDPQRGRYIVKNPAAAGSRRRSFLLPRTISPKMTPRKMAEAWAMAKTGDQKKSFYNRTLARPYIDANQLPVTLEHCENAARLGMAAGLRWETSGQDCYMGIDQMGGFNAVVIKKRLPSGHQAYVHVEAIFNEDPFARCSELMDLFGVAVCVVEQLPNVNDARRFANRHKGRVFLAGYADLRDDMLQWGDDLSRSDRKTADEDRSRYTVTLNQYKVMQTALYRIRDAHCLFPDPGALEQEVIENGVPRRMPIVRDWVFTHFTKTALVVEVDDETRKTRAKVVKVGIDPHYSFANMLCDVAWARSHGNSQMILPGVPTMRDTVKAAAEIEAPVGLPSAVAAAIIETRQAADLGQCGSCEAFQNGRCRERGFIVRADDAACEWYVPTES